jgi:ankyrin repeat protein
LISFEINDPISDPFAKKDRYGGKLLATGILKAACHGDITTIERLLAEGSHVSERNIYGTTAIMVAV